MRNFVIMLSLAGISFVILAVYLFGSSDSGSNNTITSSSITHGLQSDSKDQAVGFTTRKRLQPAPPLDRINNINNIKDEEDRVVSFFRQQDPPIMATCQATGKVYNKGELQRHKQPDDAWVLIHGMVLNVTDFVNHHPGGVAMIMKGTGGETDAAELFMQFHQPGTVSLFKKFCIGVFVPGQ